LGIAEAALPAGFRGGRLTAAFVFRVLNVELPAVFPAGTGALAAGLAADEACALASVDANTLPPPAPEPG
jgi:hypothetical protein